MVLLKTATSKEQLNCSTFLPMGQTIEGIIYLAAKYKNTQFAVDSLLKEFL